MQSGMPRRMTTMKDSHIPNLKYLPPTNGFTSFAAISIRVGLRVESQEKFHRDSGHDRQKFTGSNGHPRLSGSNGRPLTRSGFNDVRNYTTKRTGF
jgi:hypothetical protein